jgi:spermidine/putrescine transport system substrate-binding protein
MTKKKGETKHTWRFTRRRFLKGSAAAAAVIAASGVTRRVAWSEENTLSYLCWPGHGAEEVVGPFEQANGVKIISKEYVGGEAMMALINQSDSGTYDVVLSDREYITMLRAGGLIDEMDPNDYPFDDFWPEFQKMPGHWLDGKLFSVVLDFGYLGIVHNTDVISEKEASSYKILWDPKLTGKVGQFDWYLPSMGCLSQYNGNKSPFDIDDAAFSKLRDTVFSLKPQVAGYHGIPDIFNALKNGDAFAYQGIGDWITILLAADGYPVTTTIPDEGGIQWTESLSLSTGGKKQAMAKKFIQYLTSPEGQIRVALKSSYMGSIPNKKGWTLMNETKPEGATILRHRFDQRNVMDEYADGKIALRQLPAQQSIDDWSEVWNEYKNI